MYVTPQCASSSHFPAATLWTLRLSGPCCVAQTASILPGSMYFSYSPQPFFLKQIFKEEEGEEQEKQKPVRQEEKKKIQTQLSVGFLWRPCVILDQRMGLVNYPLSGTHISSCAVPYYRSGRHGWGGLRANNVAHPNRIKSERLRRLARSPKSHVLGKLEPGALLGQSKLICNTCVEKPPADAARPAWSCFIDRHQHSPRQSPRQTLSKIPLYFVCRSMPSILSTYSCIQF